MDRTDRRGRDVSSRWNGGNANDGEECDAADDTQPRETRDNDVGTRGNMKSSLRRCWVLVMIVHMDVGMDN